MVDRDQKLTPTKSFSNSMDLCREWVVAKHLSVQVEEICTSYQIRPAALRLIQKPVNSNNKTAATAG
jgi:hypothetical protein